MVSLIFCEHGWTLEQVSPSNWWVSHCLKCSRSGQVQWGSEQLSLVEGVSAHGKGLELDYLKGPFQIK